MFNINNSIPICPMLSCGSGHDMVCMQEKCAWYMKNSKLCSIYIVAHNNLLEIQKKQSNNNNS